mmetsp:Transcript_512/g.767  ORF Transcript_512/g.767 Transcript_512/m.767 type:complete len:514 (-) Transcript_512:113-1654(-)
MATHNRLVRWVLFFWLLFFTVTCSTGNDVCVGGTCADKSPACGDSHENCENWASLGECNANPAFMLPNCRSSCKTCDLDGKELENIIMETLNKRGECDENGTCKPPCVDTNEKCAEWADGGECDVNPSYMLYSCRSSCKTCDLDEKELKSLAEHKRKLHLVGGDERMLETPYGITQTMTFESNSDIKEVMKKMEAYIDTVVNVDPEYEDVYESCKNRDPNCLRWKIEGRCSEETIQLQCAPMCQICEVLDIKYRCPIDETEPRSLKEAGELNQLFNRIVTDPYFQEQYQPTILSQPSQFNSDKEDSKDGPWVVLLDNFVSEDECDRLIELGGELGYHRSADVGAKSFDGKTTRKISNSRTSTNAWCRAHCETDPVAEAVTQRIVNLTGVDSQNYEWFQLLQYEVGQYYKVHHDFSEHHLDRQFGSRILTVFLYLNTVTEGGGTNFPNVTADGTTVQPQRGRAVIWPSVLDENPNKKDPRTDHQALPILEGVKYGANAWIHQRNFKETANRGCT